MNDGSIGNVGSGATTRANQDTFQLYKTIWDGVIDAWAPVSTGRGASAIADFIANKKLTLPLSLGRALAGAGSGAGLTARVLGQNVGAETHTLVTTELPDPITTTAVTGNFQAAGTSAIRPGSGGAGSIGNTGGGQPHSIMQPTSFFNVFIKL